MENEFKCEICKTAYKDKYLAEKCMKQCREKNIGELSKLSSEQKDIMENKGTEKPFTSNLLYNKEEGTYHCAKCGTLLFKSDTKFDSGSGWPSFSDAVKENIELREDNNLGMKRTEVICKTCKSHLGHLFDDGPKPTGKRYCINGLALGFKKDKKQ